MKKLFGSIVKPPCTVDVDLEPSGKATTGKSTILVNNPKDRFGNEGVEQRLLVFDQSDPIQGKVKLSVEKPFDHLGITIELFGEIVTYLDGRNVSTFLSLSKELAPPTAPNCPLSRDAEYEFSFKSVDKEWNSYRGINVDVRYYLRVTVNRSVKVINTIIKEQEFWVQKIVPKPSEDDPGIGMEVGLEGIVLLSIKYNNVQHDIKNGCILGDLQFFLVNVKIDKAEVSIIRKETLLGTPSLQVSMPSSSFKSNSAVDEGHSEQEVLHKFEIIDGTPAKDEKVPVRLYLRAIEPWKLTNTEESVNKKFSVKYFIHLALCDTKGRRFFKQREIQLYRTGL
ncbi:hypothetical protein FDP41_002981 [Naegleria fowleri]|uniref:Vacuolar protein sorting-associated protein 26 n=1 Tax=Naegleria fowleri TaxID=5763 RepID=A0A6A5BXJ3_NAEFO|nr:uncharacterized protein FDP41_002981 [Naegleria fowleri]KAF0977659.1 hypothetical protein FDP41_002981 [Naegleria fowleri]